MIEKNHSRRIYDMDLCPFCGGQPYLEYNTRMFINGQSKKCALVRCKDCGARAGRYPLEDYGRTSRSAEAEQSAVDHWNMRYGKMIGGKDE